MQARGISPMELILASQSPRRQELFELIGLPFTVFASDADEDIPFTRPGEYVEKLALRKAETVFSQRPHACVVGADTIVWLNGTIIGKPRDEQDAYRILRTLSGQTHAVYTGLAVLAPNSKTVLHDVTHVTFAPLSDAEIWAYVHSGEPMDKAGAYGVQGKAAIFVERVEGCYFTVIGLPVPKLYRALDKLGIRPEGM